MFTAQFSHRNTAFGLAQDRKDLGFAVSGHLHLNLLVHLAEKILLPQPLTFGWDYRPLYWLQHQAGGHQRQQSFPRWTCKQL
jgi:hypothetical protein